MRTSSVSIRRRGCTSRSLAHSPNHRARGVASSCGRPEQGWRGRSGGPQPQPWAYGGPVRGTVGSRGFLIAAGLQSRRQRGSPGQPANSSGWLNPSSECLIALIGLSQGISILGDPTSWEQPANRFGRLNPECLIALIGLSHRVSILGHPVI